MDLVFSNELILDNIFAYLSTPDLLLRANRTASKWNQIAKKLVQLKRKIFLNSHNIMRYVDMISAGGTGHKYIYLKFTDAKHKGYLSVKDVPKITALFSKIGNNVRGLDLKENFLLNGRLGYIYLWKIETDFFCRILYDCPNVENFSIRTFPRDDFISTKLDFSELKHLNSLTSLKLGNWSFVHNLSPVLCSFLRVAPNIREIYLKGYLPINFEDLLEVEEQFPSLFQKVVECKIWPNRKNADFLTFRNFNSLRKLKFILMNKEEICYDQILTHFSHQLVYLEIDMGIWRKCDLQVLDLTLPVMRNLEILKLNEDDFWFEKISDRKFGCCKFWNCEGGERVFPKLSTFHLSFNGDYSNKKIKSEECEDKNEILESICKVTFPKKICHPIFPSVKIVRIDNSILEDFFDELGADRKSRILNLLKNYFPNLSLFF